MNKLAAVSVAFVAFHLAACAAPTSSDDLGSEERSLVGAVDDSRSDVAVMKPEDVAFAAGQPELAPFDDRRVVETVAAPEADVPAGEATAFAGRLVVPTDSDSVKPFSDTRPRTHDLAENDARFGTDLRAR